MPFEQLETSPRPSHVKSGTISYKGGKYKKGDRAKVLPKLTIGISATVCGPYFNPQGVKFGLLIGTGDEKGKARIQPVEKGGITPSVTHGGCVIRFGYIPSLGEDEAAKEDLDIKLVGTNTFEFVLPAWFKTEGDD